MFQHEFRKLNFTYACWLLVFALGLTRMGAAETVSHFEQANRLYEQGKFAEAASIYESMIKSGQQSAAVFFNLGNAYFKNDQPGRALFNYRMAERLSPRDPDIQANLRFTRDRVTDSVSMNPSIWSRMVQYFTLNELAIFCAILFWLVAALYCAAQWRPSLKPKVRTTAAVSVALFVVSLILLVSAFISSRRAVAITIAPQVTVHLGPLAESQPAFNAPAGSELQVLAQREGWFQVQDRSDRSGWVAATNVLIFPDIDPRQRL